MTTCKIFGLSSLSLVANEIRKSKIQDAVCVRKRTQNLEVEGARSRSRVVHASRLSARDKSCWNA